MKKGYELGAGIATGYFLGRTRKLKLALGVASWVAGKKLGVTPREAVVGLGRRVVESPEVKGALQELGGDARSAAQEAISAAVGSQVGSLAHRLHERTERLRPPGNDAGTDDTPDDGGSQESGEGRSTPARFKDGGKGGTRREPSSRRATSGKAASRPTSGRSPSPQAGGKARARPSGGDQPARPARSSKAPQRRARSTSDSKSGDKGAGRRGDGK